MADPDPIVTRLSRDILSVKKGLRQAGVAPGLIDGIATRALLSQRRQTGPYQSNRARRWRLQEGDPQYGTEEECKRILLKLYGQLLEFQNPPPLDGDTRAILEGHAGRALVANSYRDSLTLEPLDYAALAAEAAAPQHGSSDFHLGHEDPTTIPRHVSGNINWRTRRSNLIQGNLTLRQARTRLLEIIARYFELGEVEIQPEE